MGKCCCLVFILIVAMVIVGVSIGVPLAVKKAKETANNVKQGAADAACQATSYPATCNQTLAGGNYTADSKGMTKISLMSADTGVNNTLDYVMFLNGTNPNVTAAVEVCVEVLGLSQEQIEAAAAALDSLNATTRQQAMDDIKAWMSAAMELHTTCIDAFYDVSPGDWQSLQQHSNHTDQLFSNALAFINAMAAYGDDITQWKPTGFSLPSSVDLSDLSGLHIPPIPGFGNRRLLSSRSDWVSESDSLPAWMDTQTQRHLLQTTSYDVVVAQDGTGNFKTIQAAVDAHKVNNQRLVIYVKAGIYNEQVTVPKKAKFLTIIGDGDSTVITGSRNVALMKGMTTFKSATLIVQGEGFIGKSFRVENTAGAAGHQACAYRGTADKLAFQSVTFDSFQDTLYAHSFRQFFRECTIRGTVDFMFGNAAASFQNCNIVAKKTTLLGQQNTYSAQGRTDPHQSTGLAYQNCTFDGEAALKSNTTYYKTFLGRPWKAYSVCVIMKSQLMAHIDPTGWLPWNASTFGLYTSYFAEYANTGAGSSLNQRVTWSHPITSASIANKYQANSFVQASSWVSVPLSTTL
ncbi:hypothetical protein M758_10G062100 [Ceratodon purpureus]|nr:hypothetical protein M758_10G062100 [Ceratodon purpureus]